MFRVNLSKSRNFVKSNRNTLILVLFFLCVGTAGLSALEEGETVRFDKILPSDTLLYLGIDDYESFEAYAESMPMAKILKEEEVQAFLEKPRAFLNKNLEELKKELAAKNEMLAEKIESMMNWKMARFFMALTHIKFTSMGNGEEWSIPFDVGLTVGFSLQGGINPAEIVKGFTSTLAEDQGMKLAFQQGEYNGLAYETVTMKDMPLFFIYLFHLGDLFVITTSENSLKSMVDLHTGAAKESLAQNKEYKNLSQDLSLSGPGTMNSFMDLHGFINLIKEGAKMALMTTGEMEYVGKVDEIMDKLGLQSLGVSLSRSMSQNGEARSESVTSYRGKPTGILSVFPRSPIDKNQLNLVPKDVMNFSLFQFDVPALYDLIMDIVKSVDEEAYSEMQEGMQGLCAALSAGTGEDPIDIRRDLLGQLGSGCIYYTAGGGGGAMGMMMPSMNLLFEVKDYDALVSTLKKMIEGVGNLHPEAASEVTLSSISFSDQEIHYLQFTQVPMMTPCFTKVSNYLAFGLQIDDLKKLIKRHKAEEKKCILDNEDFSTLFDKLPQNAHVLSLSYSQTKAAFSSTYNQLAMSIPLMTMALPQEVDLPVDLQMLPTSECIENHLFSSFSATVMVGDLHYKTITYGPFGCELMRYVFPVGATAVLAVRDYMMEEGLGMIMGQKADQGITIQSQYEEEPEVDQEAFFEAQVRTDLASLSNGCFVYKIEYNKYPAKLEDLLVPTEDWPNGFYNAEKLPLDPWGNPYHYQIQKEGEHNYMIWSSGPNKIDEEGKGDDIVKIK